VPHERGVRKEAKELARRVNAVGDGWTADLQITGGGTSHRGIAYIVRHQGEYVTRISGNPSVPGLALKRAEADIRRHGCPLPRKGITPKKEDTMAAPTAVEKERSAELRGRLQTALNDRFGGDHNAMIATAIEMVEENPELDQFGKGKSSAPRDIAWAGLMRFLEGGAFKEPNLERWGYVLDRLNGAEAPATEQAVGPQPVTPAEDEADTDRHLTYEELAEQLRLERETRRLAEEVVEDIERERDEARNLVANLEGRLESTEAARASLAKRADKLEKDLKAKPEADPATARKLESTRTQLADALAAASEARTLAEQAVEEAANEPITRLRDELGTVLVGILKTVDGEPGSWLLDRLDALAGLVEAEAS
jgi:hypothetical protein